MKASMLCLVCAAAVAACMVSPVLAQTDSKNPSPDAKKPMTQPTAPKAVDASKPKSDVKPVVDKVSWVELKTSMGDIVIEVDGEKAPFSASNFLTYVGEGFYDGTIFHRVIPNFMVQGGGFTTAEKPGSNPEVVPKTPTHPPVKNEWQNSLKNKRGTVSMARTQVADSATSQFFINVKDNDFLDQPRDGAAYAVFGKVISGMDVVDKIKAVPTGYKSNMRDVPNTPVVIEKAWKLTEDEAKKVKRDEPAPGATTPAPASGAKPAPAPTTPTKTDPKSSGGR